MPRPTAAQLAYGSVTVVFSTLAMLLLSETSSGIGIAVIGTAALGLGLLVAVTVPLPSRARKAKAATAREAIRMDSGALTVAAPEEQPHGAARTRIPAARSGRRADEHSLRR